MTTQSTYTLNALFITSALLLTACAPNTYVALLTNPDGSVGEVSVKGEKGETVINQANTGANLDGSTKQAFKVDSQQLQADFGRALDAQPPLPVNFLLYFQEGGTRLTPESEALIPTIIQTIRSRNEVDISIIGHTDTVGDDKLNEQLALQRAELTSVLFDQDKLNIKEMTITSHGEKNLLVPTRDNTSEARNRRVEISIR